MSMENKMPELKCKCGTPIAEIGNARQIYTYGNYYECPNCKLEMCTECFEEHGCNVKSDIKKAIEDCYFCQGDGTVMLFTNSKEDITLYPTEPIFCPICGRKLEDKL